MIDEGPMSAQWYVLRSKPHKEDQLWRHARGLGIEVFYPRIRVHPVNPRSRKVRPYFPGYLFVRSNLAEEGLSTFQYMPYANGLVAFGGEAAPVPEGLVRALQRRMDELWQAGGELFSDVAKGDPVAIKAGPFEGYEALFDARLSGGERVRVLLEMLSGRRMFVELSSSLIEPIERS